MLSKPAKAGDSDDNNHMVLSVSALAAARLRWLNGFILTATWGSGFAFTPGFMLPPAFAG
jgi:hypothetical protein